MLTLQDAIELLKKENPPAYLTLILSELINQHDIDIFHKIMLRNTSVTRICIRAEKPNTKLPKSFLDAMLDVMCRNTRITDFVYKDCVIPEKYYEQLEEQLALNNRYADELRQIAEPIAASLRLGERNSEQTFENKLIKLQEEITTRLNDGVISISLNVIEENITIARIKQLVELRKKYPQITKLYFSVSVDTQENYEQFAIACSALTDGLSGLRFYIFGRADSTEAESNLIEKTWLCSLHALKFHSTLQELMLRHIDIPTATRIANILSENQSLCTLSISVKENACLTTLSDGLRVNSTLRYLELRDMRGCKQGLMDICSALQAHPVLTTLVIGNVEFDEQLFDNILLLLKCNSSIKKLVFLPYYPLPTEYFIKLCAALEANTILHDLHVVPSQFTVNCAEALNKLLTRNRTLQVLNIVSFSYSPIQSSTAAIKELFSHLPRDCHLIDLCLENIIFGDDDYAEVLPDLYRVLRENKNLLKFTFAFDKSHSFSEETKNTIKVQATEFIEKNEGNRFEVISLHPIVKMQISDGGIYRKNMNKRVGKKISCSLKAIQKVLTHLPYSEDEDDLLEEQARELFNTLLAPDYVCSDSDFRDQGQDRTEPNLHELTWNIISTMTNRWSFRNELDKAYAFLSVASHNQMPEANTRLVELLFPDINYVYGMLSKQQWQQYLLLLLINADLESDIAMSLTKKILRSLQTGKDENYSDSFVDLIGADRPLGYEFLIKIAESILTSSKDPKFKAPIHFNWTLMEQLQDVLNDKSMGYIAQFNMLRAHPAVKSALLNKYGTVNVVCFEELILRKGQKFSSVAPIEWGLAYQVYLIEKQQRPTPNPGLPVANDFAELNTIIEKFDEFYDIVFLTQEVRLKAIHSVALRQQLINLATHIPRICAFLGALFFQLNDIPTACQYFTRAATQGEFSEIKVLRKAAKEGKSWAIELLSQPLFTNQYSQMWLFLGNCYARHEKMDQALDCYQKMVPMTSEALVSIGNCHVKLGDDLKAITCFRQADPVTNEDACTALELLAKKKQHASLMIVLADIYRRRLHNAADSNTLTNALRYNFNASQEENADAKSFLTNIALNPAISPQFYVIAVKLEDHPEEIELAKQLYAMAQETHPVARLELMRLERPPVMTQKEKVFEEQPQSYSKCLSAYFYDFSEISPVGRRIIIQSDNKDVALNICRYLNAGLTLSPKEILTWLREKAINNNQRISGELARMFCCAIVQLKKWSGITVVPQPEVTPLLPPAWTA